MSLDAQRQQQRNSLIHDAQLWIAVLLVLLAGTYLVLSLGYEVGTLERPGPGFLPRLIGGMMLLGAVVNLVQEARRAILTTRDRTPPAEITESTDPAPAEDGQAPAHWRAWAVAGAVAAGLLITPWVGFLIGLAVVVAVVSYVLGDGSWTTTGYITLAAMLATWLIFDVLIGLPIPRGTLTGI